MSRILVAVLLFLLLGIAIFFGYPGIITFLVLTYIIVNIEYAMIAFREYGKIAIVGAASVFFGSGYYLFSRGSEEGFYLIWYSFLILLFYNPWLAELILLTKIKTTKIDYFSRAVAFVNRLIVGLCYFTIIIALIFSVNEYYNLVENPPYLDPTKLHRYEGKSNEYWASQEELKRRSYSFLVPLLIVFVTNFCTYYLSRGLKASKFFPVGSLRNIILVVLGSIFMGGVVTPLIAFEPLGVWEAFFPGKCTLERERDSVCYVLYYFSLYISICAIYGNFFLSYLKRGFGVGQNSGVWLGKRTLLLDFISTLIFSYSFYAVWVVVLIISLAT